MNERLQFRRLLRSFSYRFLDNELLSAEGDARQTMVHTLALIGALGVTLSLMYFYKYEFSEVPFSPAFRAVLAWSDREFLISLSMAVTGIIAVVLWDALFPDRRDCLTLSLLPVRSRTIFAAKLVSVLLMFLVVTAALNGPTSLFFPWIVLGDRASPGLLVRSMAAHVVALYAASAFVFFTMLALQGLLIGLLRFRQYKWISTWVQLAALVTFLSVFFFTPNIAQPERLADPAHHFATHIFPAFWFLGLYQELLGSGQPVVHELAGMARAAIAISGVLALAAYSLAYRRYVRKTIEEAEALAGTRRSGWTGAPRLLDRLLWMKPAERAVFHFAARTLARNRKHRLMLAIYGGLGLAYVFQSLGWLIHKGHTPRAQTFDISISAAPLILSFFILLGMRVLFTIPVEIEGNWIFRLTENGRPAEYLAAARKLMIAVGIAPLALGTFPIYGLLWGWSAAVRHLVLVLLILLVVVEFLVREFQKAPFTCSFLPGKANLKAKFGWYAVLFLVLAFAIGTVENVLVRTPAQYWKGVLALSLVLAYRAWRRHQWEGRLAGLMYEERANLVVSLDLGLSR